MSTRIQKLESLKMLQKKVKGGKSEAPEPFPKINEQGELEWEWKKRNKK